MLKYLVFLLTPLTLYAQKQNNSIVDKKVDSLLTECRRLSRQPDSLFIVGDALLKLAHSENHDKAFIEGYFAQGLSNYRGGNPNQAILYYDSAIVIQKKDISRHYKSHARIVRNRGIAKKFTGSHLEAKEDYLYLIQLADQYNDPRTLAIAYNQLGVLEKDFNRPESAIEYYNKSLHIWDSLGIDSQRQYIFTNLGIIHGITGQRQQQLKYLKIALQIAKNNNMILKMNQAYNNLSVTYRTIGYYDSALFCLNKVLPYFKERGLISDELRTEQNIAHTLMFLEKYDSAKFIFDRIIIGYDSIGMVREQAEVYRLLGELNFKVEKYDSALSYYGRSLIIAKEHNLNSKHIQLFEGIAEVYEKMANYEAANKFLRYKEQVKDSSYVNIGLKTLSEILANYEVEKKDQQIDILSEKKDFYRSILVPSILGLLILIVLAFYLYKMLYSSKKDILLKEDELDKLREELSKIQSEQSENQTVEVQLIHLKSKAIISANDLMYIKSDTHYLEFYLKNKNKPEIDRTTFKEIELLLPVGQFVRVHRSFLVNIHFIKIINSTQLMLENGDWINLSRTYKPMLKKMIRSGTSN